MDPMKTFFSLNSPSPSSSESEEICLGVISNVIIPEVLGDTPKNENFFEETVPLYSEQQFIQHFRVSRRIVEELKDSYENSDWYPKKDTGYKRVESIRCILAFLWYASNEAASIRDVADRFNLAISTLHGIIENVTRFLSDLSCKFIKWPSVEECNTISQEFAEMGFPGAIVCIDGTHIRIDTSKEDSDSYLNRKKFHSIQVQIVCDDKKKIRDVFIGYPGSVHDARVFRNSPLFANLAEKCGDKFILGDSAYPCLRNLLTPYKDTGNLSNTQKNYNKKLSHCRVFVEHTIGLLKQRYQQLFHIKSRNIDFICHFIRACCVLHNICTDNEICATENYEDFPIENPENHNIQEDFRDEIGQNYRNYVAAMLNI